jgi:prevent-host-death family protein
MQTVRADDATAHLPYLLDQVARGETITITRDGMPIALLVPVTDRAFTSPREVIDDGRRSCHG